MAAAMPLTEDPVETSQWADPPPPNIDEQEFDRLAFELWQLASRAESIPAEEWLDLEEPIGRRASCL